MSFATPLPNIVHRPEGQVMEDKCQGTTLVVPQNTQKEMGFSPTLLDWYHNMPKDSQSIRGTLRKKDEG
jgi:hypothetical protein